MVDKNQVFIRAACEHDITLYPQGTPAHIDPQTATPNKVFPGTRKSGGTPAQMGTRVVGHATLGDGTPIVLLEPTGVEGLPPYAGDMDIADRRQWHIASTVAAVAAIGRRGDVLVRVGSVRDHDGRGDGATALGMFVGWGDLRPEPWPPTPSTLFDHLHEACLAAAEALAEDPRLRRVLDDEQCQLAAATAVKAAAADLEQALRAKLGMKQQWRVSVPTKKRGAQPGARHSWSDSADEAEAWDSHDLAAAEGVWGEPHVETRFTGATDWTRVERRPGT